MQQKLKWPCVFFMPCLKKVEEKIIVFDPMLQHFSSIVLPDKCTLYRRLNSVSHCLESLIRLSYSKHIVSLFWKHMFSSLVLLSMLLTVYTKEKGYGQLKILVSDCLPKTFGNYAKKKLRSFHYLKCK